MTFANLAIILGIAIIGGLVAGGLSYTMGWEASTLRSGLIGGVLGALAVWWLSRGSG